MSDGLILSGYLLVFFLLFAFIFWRAWRTYTPTGFAMYLAVWGCLALGVVSAVQSTLPSSAPRLQAFGFISKIATHKQGRSSSYTVYFRTDDGRDLVLDGAAIPPFFAEGSYKVAVTYLDEHAATHYPRAIMFRALTGPRAGETTAVNADWFGPWLGVVAGVTAGVAAIIGANNRKRLP